MADKVALESTSNSRQLGKQNEFVPFNASQDAALRPQSLQDPA